MIRVIAENFIKREHLETVKPLLEELVEKTRQEKECISYDLCVNEEDDTHFVFIEAWPSHEALERHCNTEHFKRIVPIIDSYASAEEKVLLMSPFK